MPVGSGMDYQKKEKRGIMKRRLLFLLMLPLALGLWAQAGDYDQTYIIGRLAFQGEILQGTTPLMGFEPQSIAVQAFVTGVPLSDSTLPTWRGTADDGFYYYELPVINTTEADLAGEEIEVRLLLGDYALGLATGLTYTGTTTTYGSLSQPVLFNVVTPSVVMHGADAGLLLRREGQAVRRQGRVLQVDVRDETDARGPRRTRRR